MDSVVGQWVDPAWASINLSRLDGNVISQALQAPEEACTRPFGPGARLVVLQRSLLQHLTRRTGGTAGGDPHTDPRNLPAGAGGTGLPR
jgi:hypothetical protein